MFILKFVDSGFQSLFQSVFIYLFIFEKESESMRWEWAESEGDTEPQAGSALSAWSPM